MDNIFMIADTHFGHKNIMAYENRPFQSVEEMDSRLIENWNSVVQKQDKVFLLGDVSFYGKEKTQAIIRRLHGHKTLILGNHDTSHSAAWWADAGFDLVSPYPVIFREWFMLSHEPLYMNTNMPYANIFGHVHSNPAYQDYSPQTFCVSAERIGYTPISFEEIMKCMQSCAGGQEQDLSRLK